MVEILGAPFENKYHNATELQAWWSTRTTGVYALDNELKVEAAGGMAVRVLPGQGWLQTNATPGKRAGISFNSPDEVQITLDMADGVLSRIDRVVVRYTYAIGEYEPRIVIDIKKGANASTPAAPALTRTVGVAYEIALADIIVRNGAVSITQADITDTRPDAQLCGVMNDAINSLARQYEVLVDELIPIMSDTIFVQSPWTLYGGMMLCPYRNRREITSSQSWTCPQGVTKIGLFMVGGGGPGGAGSGGSGGGGGGGHTVFRYIVNVTPGQSYPITIGGSGGTTSAFSLSANAGSAGGVSSVANVGGNGGSGGGGGGGGGGSGGSNGYGGSGGSNGSVGGPGSTGTTMSGGAPGGGGNGDRNSARDPFTGRSYAGGGGGGGSFNNGTAGGPGGRGGSGGGNGGTGSPGPGMPASAGASGVANTGGGGGGGGGGAVGGVAAPGGAGGAGGSGIVIIYY